MRHVNLSGARESKRSRESSRVTVAVHTITLALNCKSTAKSSVLREEYCDVTISEHRNLCNR